MLGLRWPTAAFFKLATAMLMLVPGPWTRQPAFWQYKWQAQTWQCSTCVTSTEQSTHSQCFAEVNDQDFWTELPAALRTDMALELARPLFAHSDIFKALDDTAERQVWHAPPQACQRSLSQTVHTTDGHSHRLISCRMASLTQQSGASCNGLVPLQSRLHKEKLVSSLLTTAMVFCAGGRTSDALHGGRRSQCHTGG